MRTTKSYSLDLRRKVIAARANGHGVEESARIFGISRRTVWRYCKAHARTGSLAPKRRGGCRKSPLVAYEKSLRRWIKQQNDITLVAMQARIAHEYALCVSLTALWRQIDRLNLSYKKNASRRRARSARSAGGSQKVALATKKLGR
jgi:transposase